MKTQPVASSMPRPAVRVAVLSYTGEIAVETAAALLSSRDQCRTVQWIVGDCSIPSARNKALADFLASEDDLLVFVDADIAFTPADLAELIRLGGTNRHRRSSRIVGGLYAGRLSGAVQWRPLPEHRPGVRTHDLVEVEWVATGFMAIPREALLQIRLARRGRVYQREGRDERDYFPAGATLEGEWITDDVAFCRLARNAGVTVCGARQVTVSHRAHRWMDVGDPGAGSVLRVPGRPQQCPRQRLKPRRISGRVAREGKA